MARIERIARRLDNWALWKARQNDAGLGYHTKSILLVDVWNRGSYGGANIPHFEEEGALTDQAVESLKLGKGHLHVTLEWFYLRDMGITEVAWRMSRSVATVHSNLAQADQAIAAWLDEWHAEQERQRVAQAQLDRKMSFTG